MSTISIRSDAQREASRTNGANSNGPVSIEGKNRSSQNATKHGLRSPRVVLANEDPDKYRKLLATFVAEWNPLGITESDLLVRMVNAPDVREIIFVRNATEAINLVAYSWGMSNLGPGDVVVVTELEHHSNFVPWQFIAGRTGAQLAMIPLTDEGELELSALDEIAAQGNVKVVATGLVSNSLGTINPTERIVAWAHEQGAIFVSDAAQAAPHLTVDVQALGVDFVAISAHKMCGPSGVGALWGRAELLTKMDPFLTGGHMISSVRFDRTTWGELPHKFEAGTAPMAEAVGFGAAIDYLSAVGFDAIEAYEHELAAYALGRLGEVEGITLYGPPADRRAGIVSFNVEGIHPHDVAQILDMQGVAIRAGHHCCQPLMQKLGVAATNRASFYLYTVQEEIDQLVDGLHTVRKVFA